MLLDVLHALINPGPVEVRLVGYFDVDAAVLDMAEPGVAPRISNQQSSSALAAPLPSNRTHPQRVPRFEEPVAARA